MIIELVAASSVAGASCPAATETQVRGEFATWVKAFEAHDLTGTMAIFSPQLRFEFQGSPDQDWKGLRDNYERGFAKSGRSRWVPEWDQIIVSDRTAAAFSTWTGIVTRADGTDEVRAKNRGVDVLKRGADCHWRIVRSLSYPMKAPPAAAAK